VASVPPWHFKNGRHPEFISGSLHIREMLKQVQHNAEDSVASVPPWHFKVVVTLTCSEAESYEVNLFQGLSLLERC